MRLFYDMKSNLYNVLTLKCLSKTNISAEHYIRLLLDNNKNQNKQKTKNKYSLNDCTVQFFNFSYKNTIHDKILLFDVTLLVKKHDAGGLR